MRTVKDFKDAGVHFVEGDMIYNDYFALHYWLNGGSSMFKKFEQTRVGSFAWRDLTTKPDNAKFKIELDIANNRWRPSLNQGEEWPDEQRVHYADSIKTDGEQVVDLENVAQQVEALASDKPVKPVFTQAMADAGELPPVGYKLKFTHDIDGGFGYLHSEKYGWEHGDNLEVIHVTENHHGEPVVIVLNSQRDVLTTAVIAEPMFFDTRTEEEKAIDEMLLLAIDSVDDVAKSIICEACFKLYKAGYRKNADA